MAADIKQAVAALILVAAVAGPAHSQGEITQRIYASIENNIRGEYVALMEAVAGGATGAQGAHSEESQRMLKEMFYNKAVLFASCAAEAELHRAPQAPRLPANRNLLLTTCVEQKFAELNKFTNVRSYAGIFFPDRIRTCGEASRLREQEGLFAPYGFLQLAEPKLYNFAQYNDCLMNASTSPAAE